MARKDVSGGGGAEGRKEPKRKPRLTPRWLESVQAGNRLEFEREMQRHREGFDREFERFWRTRRHAS